MPGFNVWKLLFSAWILVLDLAALMLFVNANFFVVEKRTATAKQAANRLLELVV
jgi:hypothetical protein